MHHVAAKQDKPDVYGKKPCEESPSLSHTLQRSKTEVLIRSLLGKRWTEAELFHASWDEVPSNVKDVLRDYKKSLEVGACICVCWSVFPCMLG